MRKILIAVAAISIGVAAHAASYCWGVQSFDYLGPDGSGYDDAVGANVWSGGTAFLYLGTVAYNNGFDTTGATFIKSGQFDDVNYGYGDVDISDVTTLPTSDSINASGGQDYSIVFVDAQVTSLDDAAINNYIILTSTSTGEYDPIADVSYASFLDTTTAIGGTGVAWAAATPLDSPEPTSGLLMLFGLAGLALKRKRA